MRFPAVFAGLWALFLSGCVATTTMQTTNEFERVAENATVVLLEPDVEIRFIKASELREMRADWTEEAETNLTAALRTQLEQRDVDLTFFRLADATEREIQLIKLHEVVGNTILLHRFFDQPLPSKEGKFDWSLGPGVQEFAKNNDADYALLLFARGEYASSGKQITNILMAAAGIGGGSTGGQIAFASLIDLTTGDVAWFNVAQTGAGTDMRKPEGAAYLIENLLKKLPL